MLECATFNNICHNYCTVSTMKELFETANMQHIIDCIKDINFYH